MRGQPHAWAERKRAGCDGREGRCGHLPARRVVATLDMRLAALGLDPSGEIRPELYTENGMKSVMILESSQASQVVGPVNSDVEMAAGGRSFLDVGFKMCHAIPLCTQTGDVVEQVKADGNYVPGGYVQMIKDARTVFSVRVFLCQHVADSKLQAGGG